MICTYVCNSLQKAETVSFRFHLMTETEVMFTNIHVHTDSWVRVLGFITVTEGTMASLAVHVYVGNSLLLWFS